MADEILMNAELKGRLVAEINEAFGDLPVPDPRKLIRRQSLKDRIVNLIERPEEEQIRQELADKRWQDLTSEFLGDRLFSFMYLSTEAYRYYLPALLVRAIEETDEDSKLAHSVVYSLLPSFWCLYYRGDDRELRAKQAAFSPRQYLAVCAFLGFMFGHWPRLRHLAAQALRWGWNAMQCPALESSTEYYQRFFTYSYPEPADPELAVLFHRIHAAFADTPYPGDNNMCGSDQDDEPAEYAMEFRGQKWQSIHPEFLLENGPALSFLSDAGLCYYLPAFLLADICHEPPWWTMADELAPDCEHPDMFEWRHGRWRSLTGDQRDVVREYLSVAVTRIAEQDYFTQQASRTALELWSGTAYEDLLARQPSVAEAEVTFLTSEESGKVVGAFDGYQCEIRFAGHAAECRLDFPDRREGGTYGFLRPGETGRATLALKAGAPELQFLHAGTPFEIWDRSRKVAIGRVTGRSGDIGGPQPPSSVGE